MTYDDLNDHPFAVFMAGESYVSPTERAWLAWCKECERLLGHDLDGDQATDGYSMDAAYAAWEAGVTAAEHRSETSPSQTTASRADAMFEIIDTLDAGKVVASYPTHRRAFNASRKLEPAPSVKPAWWPDAPRRSWEWRYQIRPKKS